ncbi:methyltransferase domain-containing protein, partial [Candidatus Pelagibacter sp.]|nr:methyltransferase domain-containing protein [Candidatus Pelagibacter sp.]
MKNIYLKKDTIFSIGKFSQGYGYFMFFLKKNKFIQSCLDIGCGNGNLLKLMNKKSLYLGLDSNAGIYKKKRNKKIKYFDNGKQVDEFLNKLNKKFEIVTLMDVLEHTDTFVDLFKKSLKKSSKFVMVGLPNEDCLLSRFEFLIGKGIKTHGLEM